MSLAELTRTAVLSAIAEFDRIGRAPFLARYRFGKARSYFLIHGGKAYDSKAIAGAAHGYLPGRVALTAADFSGGEATVKARLIELGFDVAAQGSTVVPVTLPEARAAHPPQCWALFANPHIYRIDEALRAVTDDRWVTKGKDLRRGDRVIIWRGRDADGQRGVVAFGEVTTDPEVMDDGVNPFWAAPQEAAAELRVVVRYVVPPGLPLWLDDHRELLGKLSVSRATGGTVFHVSDANWSAVVALAGGWPEVLLSPTARPVGKVYVNVGTVSRAAARDPFEVDPDKVDRGNQAHATTADALADHLRARGIDPKAPAVGDPEFDLAWEENGALYVAEIKSVTDANQEKQLRLGLGQVLRYRHLLGGGGRQIVAVLVAEREPSDPSWATTCAEVDVVLSWPGRFDLLDRSSELPS